MSGSRPPVSLRITLLGTAVEAENGEGAVDFGYDKVRALLVYLLLQPPPVERVELARLLWPEHQVSSARNNLRHALHTLRRVLGAEFERQLGVTRNTIRLEIPVHWRLDTGMLEALLEQPASATRLNEVLKLYHGEPAAALRLNQCAEFRGWLLQQQHRCRQRVLEFAERVLASQQTHSLAQLRHLAERFSDHTPFHQRLISELLAAGHKASAQAHHDAHLQQLELLGRQPPEEFTSLRQAAHDEPSAVVPEFLDNALPGQGNIPSEAELDHRQVTVLAMRLTFREIGEVDRHWELDVMLLLRDLMAWLEQRCRALGGHWVRGSTAGIGMACFGTHGPARQLMELVALHERCRMDLMTEVGRRWPADGTSLPDFELSAGLHSGRVLYMPERRLIDPLGQVTQSALELLYAAREGELVLSRLASQHMPPAIDLQPRLQTRTVTLDDEVRLNALKLAEAKDVDTSLPELHCRDHERHELREALDRVELGVRQNVLIRGAAGMGKSALMVNFRQVECSQHVTLFWLAATRLSQQEPCHLVTSLLRWQLGEALAEEVLDQWMTRHLTGWWDERRRARLRAILMPELHKPGEYGGEALELMTRLVLTLLSIGSGRTLVVMIDDLQWLDEASRGVLSRVQTRLPINSRVMLVASQGSQDLVTSRSGWDCQINLQPLDTVQSRVLLSRLSQRCGIRTDEVSCRRLIERSGGVPLYLCELYRWFVHDRDVGHPQQLEALPGGLHGLLSGRIDQLDVHRRVAHVAAVLGVQFSLDVLRECLGPGNSAFLREGIRRMQHLEIITSCSVATEFDYRFTNQLLQEVAYHDCPIETRRQTHHHLIGYLEQHQPEWLSRYPGHFAQHLQRSGAGQRAARYYLLAAREALARAALSMALRMTERGLECLTNSAVQGPRLTLLILRARLGFALEGHVSNIAVQSLVEARRRSEMAGDDRDPEQQFMICWGVWLVFSTRLRLKSSRAMLGHLQQLSAQLDRPCYRYLTEYARGYVDYWGGSLHQASRRFESLDLLHQVSLPDELPWSEHPRACACGYRAMTCCMRGEYQQAVLWIESAVRLAESLEHSRTRALVLIRAAVLYRHLGMPDEVRARANEVMALTEHEEGMLWQHHAHCILEWCRIRQGEQLSAEPLEAAMGEIAMQVGHEVPDHPIVWYIEGCLLLGEGERAADYLRRHLAAAQEHDLLYLAELLLLAARLDQQQGAGNRTGWLLDQAMSAARRHGSLHGELMTLEWRIRLEGSARWQPVLTERLKALGPRDRAVPERWRQWPGGQSLPGDRY
ncbi:putative ATPase [Kushneria sinocarnis]|uniref:Putative ATPase n=1 Tax=Kushneria sinocarnis TaxID=595502 RepID=A0A420WYJ7_9GAMM|nr:AAA family ATPase [Kushneria sinocarnis]RKR06299.1 putative ATPase [Kushneria sinocarnis]